MRNDGQKHLNLSSFVMLVPHVVVVDDVDDDDDDDNDNVVVVVVVIHSFVCLFVCFCFLLLFHVSC